MNTNKPNMIITGLALSLLLFVTISASYAYFSGRMDKGPGLTINAYTDAPASFTAYTSDQIELAIKPENMTAASTTPVATDNGQVIAMLSSSKEGVTVHCSYDVELVWNSTNQYTTPSMTLNNTYKYELSLKATQSVTGDTTGHKYSVTSLNETNLSGFSWQGTVGTVGRKAKVIKGAEIYSKSLTSTTATWNFVLNFYSIPEDQSNLLGKNYSAALKVTNIVC